jgi:hypothetical protein
VATPASLPTTPAPVGGNFLADAFGTGVHMSTGLGLMVTDIYNAWAKLGNGSSLPSVGAGRTLVTYPDQSTAWVILRYLNGLRNGGMERWDLGTSRAVAASTTGITGYGPTGWCLKTGANQSSTMTRVAGLTDQSRYACQAQRNGSQTGTGTMVLEHAFTTDEVVRYRNDKVSMTCAVKAGPNWSPASGNMTVRIACGTGAEGRRGAGFTGETTLVNTTQAITTSVSQLAFTSSVVVPTNATQMSISFEWTPVGTAGADEGLYVDDVMFVRGDIQMPYIALPLDIEQDRCQAWAYSVPAGDYDGEFLATTVAILWLPLPTDLRAAPALTHGVTAIGTPASTTAGIYRIASGAYVTGTFSSLDGYTLKTRVCAVRIQTTGAMSAGAAGDMAYITLPTDGLVVLNAGL